MVPIWLLTPKAGRDGHVSHSDIEEAATTSGLHAMSTFSIARRLVRDPPRDARPRSLTSPTGAGRVPLLQSAT